MSRAERGERDAIRRLEGQERRSRAHDGRTIRRAFGGVEDHDAAVEVVDGVGEALPLGGERTDRDLARGHGATTGLERDGQERRLFGGSAGISDIQHVHQGRSEICHEHAAVGDVDAARPRQEDIRLGTVVDLLRHAARLQIRRHLLLHVPGGERGIERDPAFQVLITGLERTRLAICEALSVEDGDATQVRHLHHQLAPPGRRRLFGEVDGTVFAGRRERGADGRDVGAVLRVAGGANRLRRGWISVVGARGIDHDGHLSGPRRQGARGPGGDVTHGRSSTGRGQHEDALLARRLDAHEARLPTRRGHDVPRGVAHRQEVESGGGLVQIDDASGGQIDDRDFASQRLRHQGEQVSRVLRAVEVRTAVEVVALTASLIVPRGTHEADLAAALEGAKR